MIFLVNVLVVKMVGVSTLPKIICGLYPQRIQRERCHQRRVFWLVDGLAGKVDALNVSIGDIQLADQEKQV